MRRPPLSFFREQRTKGETVTTAHRQPDISENTARPVGRAVIIFALLVGLYLTTHVNYLLFHALSEVFSIVVAFSLAMIAINSRRYIESPYLLFIGIAYLFIGLLDLLHTLAYKGMPVFSDYDYYANQLWIGARYMESISLLAAFTYLYKERRVNVSATMAVFTLVTAVLTASIFYWKIFPECFIDGQGLTPFKKISEYVICGILLVNIRLLTVNKARFGAGVYRLLMGSLICTIISELAFTFYISNYGFSNLIGHYFKIFSFYLVYRAIIVTGIEEPYELIFRELSRANTALSDEIEVRKQAEAEKEMLIDDLKQALEKIDALKGILPLCSYCKKIRNDKGSWEHVDVYLHKHSKADVSHSVCPECMMLFHPDIAEED